MSDDNKTDGVTPESGAGDKAAERVAFLEAEAKKAFKARDDLKQKLRELEARTMGDDQLAEYEALRKEKAELDEKRKREAGQFDSLKQELVTKHQTELTTHQERIKALEQEIVEGELQRAFYGALDLFGDNGATIFTADMALPIFRQYVEVENEGGHRRVVVKRPDGTKVHGADGNPAPFAQALREVINQLPTKDRILRGSGKTGSGNSGGSSDSTKPADLTALIKRVNAGDAEAAKQLRQIQANKGAIVEGRGFARIRAARGA